MARTRLINLLAGAALVGVIALAAGCGGSGGGATAATGTAKAPPKATIGVANSGLGMILVDSQGRTLYLFKKDSGTTSACSGECASAWPPLLSEGKPTVGNGGNSSLVGTIKRADGSTQVTYNGHPLYTFVKDENPGETNGEGVTEFGASWFVLSPTGNQISKPSSAAGSASSTQNIVHTWTLSNYRQLVTVDVYWQTLLRSIWIATRVMLFSLVLGYPLAYFLSFHAGARKELSPSRVKECNNAVG